MLHDIAPKKLYNHYEPAATITDDDFVVRVVGRELLVKAEDGRVRFPYAKELDLTGKETTYLISIDDERYFLVEEDVETPEGFGYKSLRQLRPVDYKPKDVILAAQTCFQLNNWYKDNKFCGTCGSPTVKDERERAMRCPNCGRMIYPRILPACIIGVTHGDEILLIRGKDRTWKEYGLVAGFVEIGECLEETVQREVMEEVGLEVTNIRYYKSQPYGVVDDILTGFFCDVVGTTEVTFNDGELSVADWVRRDEIPGEYTDYTLTNEMMMLFKAGKEPK